MPDNDVEEEQLEEIANEDTAPVDDAAIIAAEQREEQRQRARGRVVARNAEREKQRQTNVEEGRRARRQSIEDAKARIERLKAETARVQAELDRLVALDKADVASAG